MQHPSHTRGGTDRGVPVINLDTSTSTKSIALLLSTYTSVPPAAPKTKEVTTPGVQGPVRPPNLLGQRVCVFEQSQDSS